MKINASQTLPKRIKPQHMLIIGMIVVTIVLGEFFTVHADENIKGNFTLGGYGTLSYSMDDHETVAPARDISQKPDNGFNTDSTFKLDSRLGLHAYYHFSDTLDFVAQGVLRDQVNLTFLNSMELAYVEFKAFPQINVRAGRFGYDAFLMSDTRNIGYAYTWVRPPTEFYSWIPVFSVDGIDAIWRIDSGDVQWSIKAQIGSSHTDIPVGDQDYEIETDNLRAITLSRQSGSLQVKIGYSKFTLNNEADALSSLHQGLGAVAAATSKIFSGISREAAFLRNNTSFQEQNITYMTLGAAYDDGIWIAQAELSHSTATSNILPHGNMAYLAVGHRLGDWTPYLMYSITHPTYDVYVSTENWEPINQEALQEQAAYILNSTRMDQQTFSLGLRWDFHTQAAVKLQWDNSYIKPYYGLWWHDLDVATHADHINSFTFSLEFMF